MKTKLYTIQKVEFLEELFHKKVIFGKEKFVDKDFLEGYHWLMQKMEERIGKSPIKKSYPIWAWYQWNNSKFKKPNLLASAHDKKGIKCVRIEFEKDIKNVLLSDFQLWHFPLSYQSYIGSKTDLEKFENRLKQKHLENKKFKDLPLEFQKKIIESWDLIFDMDFEDNYFTSAKNEKSIQATFWSLSLDEIKKIEFFTAK